MALECEKEGKPVVSIVCITFNHAPYIREALEGFVRQKTDFAYEIIVHDDASTDGTAEIIREYQQQYPELIFSVLQKTNQYSQGHKPFEFTDPLVRGEIMALCEGDDYWTDERKLQKQVEALRAHPEADICAHRACVVDATSGKVCGEIGPAHKDTVFTAEQVILGGGGFVATNSLVYRTRIERERPLFRKYFPIDYSLQISGALRGGMVYLNDCMSVYRMAVKGSWSERVHKSTSMYNKQMDCLIGMLKRMDIETEEKYHMAAEKMEKKLFFSKLEFNCEYDKMLSDEFDDVRRELPIKRQALIWIKLFLLRMGLLKKEEKR